ncbi:inositol 1,4,5-triphosphate receptor associated 2 isoform X1 [Mesoplodon densirostris]|uniref:inositol 1,4,5-triphosphate receptor associated 2 isoform X1 n=1 Tax=Mesoplodon densirostris TaxID=48708 RepID=UPI0028DCB28C|nr:inositol 1,4,5-triphosphate receptor associated 2 isoform X1 [Mesoplodon densirostris]
MASVKKATEKRHNPVQSIYRKIQAIQKREESTSSIQQIIKYQSSRFDSPQTNPKKDFEEVLKKMTTAPIPLPDPRSSSPEEVGAFTSHPQRVSPRTPSISHLSSPENATYSLILTSSENISRPRSQSSQNYTSLIPQIRKRELFSNKDLKNCCSENDFSALTLDFDSTSNQSSELFTPQDSVVKKLSLDEEGWKQGADDVKEEVTYSNNRTCEEELLTSIFNACDTKCRGSVRVTKVIDYLRQTTRQGSEDGSLEELWNMLDPEKRDMHVNLETFQAIMREWIAHCRNKWEGVNSGSSSRAGNSALEQDDIKSGGAIKMTTDITDSLSRSFEALGGDVFKGVLEMPDLITCVADLHFNKQKLEEENNKLKLALESLEDANSQLSEDCTELRLQLKSAHKAIMRTNLLKEELEELKISMNASEEQKTMIVAQNKQLEAENRALILKIQILQEENAKNIMDMYKLENKIEELSKTEKQHQMLLHTYENTLLNKDASLQKKDLSIEELKSTIIECESIIENLRGEKNKLAHELQHLQQELIVNGIQFSVSGEHKSVNSEGEKSLHCELILAQSAENNETKWQCNLISLSPLDTMMDQEMLLLLRELEQKGVEFTAMLQKLHEDVSEVETLIDSSLQWVTNPEITVKEKWENKLTEFKYIKEEKLNLCILMLNSLRNHKESLDKEFAKLIEILKRFRLEYFYFRKEFLPRQKQLEAITQLQEGAVNQEAILRKKVQEASQWLEGAAEQVEEGDQAAHSAREKAKPLLRKLEEAISDQRNLQTINTELVNTCQTLEQKTRKPKTTIEPLRKKLIEGQLHGLLFQSGLDEEFPHYDPLSCTDRIHQPLQEQLRQCCHKRHSGQEARIHQLPLTFKHTCWYTPLLDALYLDSLTAIPRLELTPFSCVANRIHASCEKPKYGEVEDGALDVTERHKCPGATGGPHPGTDLSGCIRMNNDLSMEENGVERLYSESLPQSRDYSTLPSSGHTSSTESTVTSSDSGSEILHMASGVIDCEKEEDKRSASAVKKIKGGSPAPENISLQGSVSEEKIMSNQEAKGEPETINEHRKECVAGGAAVSSLPVKSVNFRQSDNTSANEKEVEAEFLRLSLGFKCDWFTLEKRVKLEERSRDLAEENLKKEITNCLKLLESLTPLCEDDGQAQEIIKKLEKSITFLSQCTARVASRAEMLGAINQESRVSKAVEVMIQHVENLKRMYAKEHAELEELKQVLLQNERTFNPLEDEGDCQIKKRSASLNSKPSSLRRVTIASLPRNIGNAGMVAGMENNERFSRRSSSWRILGSKQSEHRPSLHRFISTYSWADAEEEKCELKTKDDSEPPEEETVERTRKLSLSEKKNNPSKWDVFSIYNTIASWATNLKTSIREANKALWLSVAFVVLFAALMSFFTGRFFQKSVDAAPTQDGDSWMSLEHILWPFTRLQHNGPPPV